MAYRIPSFYFYHGAREALSVGAEEGGSTVALFDGRQGELFVFATDLHHPPEIVPGIEKGDVESFFRIRPLLRLMRDSMKKDAAFRWETLLVWIGVPLLLILWMSTEPSDFFRKNP